ncbi:MAG: RluA family pseudouridine synthase [Phycisphaeraceae bacterium]
MPRRETNPNDRSQHKPDVAAQSETNSDAVHDELAIEVGRDESAEDGGEHRCFSVRRDIKRRLDVYLHQRLQRISRSKVRQLIDLGGVTVNGTAPKPSTTVKRGDLIDVILPPPAIRTIQPEPIPLDVLYEDDAIIVINKPANLIVHPARSHLSGTLVNALAHHFKQQIEQAGGAWTSWQTRGFREHDKQPDGTTIDGLSGVGADECRPGIVHRLDKNTTGVIVVAKNDQAHWHIARQFEDRQTIKAYLAVVHGCPDPPDAVGGVIDEPIGKHPTIREAFAVRHDHQGKQSVTLYRVRERYNGYTLLELELKTGRTHQIRVHLSYIGCPVVGDIIYGGEPIGWADLEDPPIPAGSRRDLNFARNRDEGLKVEAQAAARDDVIIAQPALHAAMLQLTHPLTRQTVRYTAPVHEPVATLVRELRKHKMDGPVATEGYWVDLSLTTPP